MSKPLPLAERKRLARLKIAFYRDQVTLNSEPILHPIQYARSSFLQRKQNADSSISSFAGPALAIGGLWLLVRKRPLGKLNKLVRLGLALYPLVNRLKRP